jgi:hypothetical protein
MTFHDAYDGWLHFFAHIARENIKGGVIGGRVISVIGDMMRNAVKAISRVQTSKNE